MPEIGVAARAMDNTGSSSAQNAGVARREVIDMHRQHIGPKQSLPMQVLDWGTPPQSDMSRCACSHSNIAPARVVIIANSSMDSATWVATGQCRCRAISPQRRNNSGVVE